MEKLKMQKVHGAPISTQPAAEHVSFYKSALLLLKYWPISEAIN